jgi:hypothetical protein
LVTNARAISCAPTVTIAGTDRAQLGCEALAVL